ncbi:MAG TPA: response regulator [Methylomirabilota bacterium]|nr:response regulator [Methylomirabilota bacterium]HWO04573.1 response regulator [Methylomirabilota bacterium]
MAPTGERPRVLVVDDESVIAQLIADVLGGEGFEVDTAPHGLAALDRLANRTYDVILSDLRMPELDGFGLFREIERRYPDLLGRFVFITGTSEHTDYQGFIDDVKVPVLTKPFDMMNLVRVVRGRLAG